MSFPNNQAIEKLFNIISKLDNADDCRLFFEDLCTIKEILDMSQRLETAVLLSKGMNYKEISKITGASSATVSRVNRCLQYGDGGYNKALSLLDSNTTT